MWQSSFRPGELLAIKIVLCAIAAGGIATAAVYGIWKLLPWIKERREMQRAGREQKEQQAHLIEPPQPQRPGGEEVAEQQEDRPGKEFTELARRVANDTTKLDHKLDRVLETLGKVNVLGGNNQDLLGKIELFYREWSAGQKDQGGFQAALRQQRDDNDRLRAEHEKLKEQLQGIRKRFQEEQQGHKQAQDDCERLRRDTIQLQRERDEFRQTGQKLQENCERLRREAGEVQRERNEYKQASQQLQENNERLRQEKLDVQRERDEYEQMSRQLQEKNDQLQAALDTARREIENERERMTESLRRHLDSRLLTGTPRDNGKIQDLVDQAVRAVMSSAADSTAPAGAEGARTSRQDAHALPAAELGPSWDLIAALLEFGRAIPGMSTAETVRCVHNLSEPIVKYVGGGCSDQLPDLQQWANAVEAFLSRCRPDGAEWAKLEIYIPPVGPHSEILQMHVRWKETTMRGFMRELLRWKATAYDHQKGELSSELAVVIP